MAVLVAAAAACAPQDDVETEETAIPPATETQPTTPEGVTGDMVLARADFQPTAAAAGRQISGFAEVRQAGTGTTGTGTTGTPTPGTATPGTATPGTAGSPGEALEVHARLEGLTAEHAWHIHEGPCSNEQAPVAVPFTEPLRATGGIAEQTAPIPQGQLTQQQLESGQYSVRVHEGGSQQAGATIACADIQRR
jgi:hypothetical protein